MSIEVLNQTEMSEVSGGLSLAVGDNPILNGGFNLTPGGTFTLLGSLIGGAMGLLGGLFR